MTAPEPRTGSLCSGYGGLDLAAKAVFGGTTAWHAELDPDASTVLAHRFPGVPNHGDITTIDWATVEPVDILTAGYPCQPFSYAGLQKGVDDERWLWAHVASAVRVLRPRWVLLENVPGHLGLGFGSVLGDLSALGFDAEWLVLAASDLGAAHQRKRLFVLAWPADAQGIGRSQRPVPAGPPRVDGQPRHPDRAPADTDRQPVRLEPVRQPGSGPATLAGRPGPGAAADAARVGEGEPADQTHPVAGSRNARIVPGGRGLLPTPRASDGLKGSPNQSHGDGSPALAAAVQPGYWGRYAPAIARHAHLAGRPAPDPTEPGRNGPRLAPRFTEWLMCLPDGWVTAVPGITRAAALRLLGNGVIPPHGQAAAAHLLHRAHT